jgi:glycosyltransferase involved in cell wall biosynthesis
MNIGIFTIHDIRKHGGLESYIRMLLDGEAKERNEILLNGREPSNEANVTSLWQRRRTCLLPFMTRRSLRIFARLAAQILGERWAQNATKNCDIVHFVGVGWDLAGFPLVKAVKRKGAKITCWPAVHPKTWGDSHLDIDLYKQMDAVFAASDFEREHLIELGVSPAKIVRSGCALLSKATGSRIRFRKDHGIEDQKIVLFIGRKSIGKGYHALRIAIRDLIEQGHNVVLVSVGCDVGAPYPRLLPEHEIDLMEADESQKQDALAACDVFVLPSEAESFGLVYVEAWTYAKPVVCGTAPASRELILRHEAGIATDGTPKEIADSLKMMFNDPGKCKLMGECGYKAFESQYTAKSVIQNHLKVWHRLTHSGSRESF